MIGHCAELGTVEGAKRLSRRTTTRLRGQGGGILCALMMLSNLPAIPPGITITGSRRLSREDGSLATGHTSAGNPRYLDRGSVHSKVSPPTLDLIPPGWLLHLRVSCRLGRVAGREQAPWRVVADGA